MGASQGKTQNMVLETENAREITMTEIPTKEPTKTEYKILLESCAYTLTERVNELLNEGWELQGGVSGHTESSKGMNQLGTSHTRLWAQAMIKNINTQHLDI
jgi:hypothetical protein